MTPDEVERGLLAAREHAMRQACRRLQRDCESDAGRLASGRIPKKYHNDPDRSLRDFIGQYERAQVLREGFERVWKRDVAALLAVGGTVLEDEDKVPPTVPTPKPRPGARRKALGIADDEREDIKFDPATVEQAAREHGLLRDERNDCECPPDIPSRDRRGEATNA